MDKKSYEYIYQKYIIEGVSRKEMCEDIGVSRDVFFSLTRKLGIRKVGTLDIVHPKDMVKDSIWLREQYKRHSTNEIASSLGIKRGSVEYWLKKHGITQKYKYYVNEAKMCVSDPVFCYWAGLVATDGHVDKVVPRATVSLVEETSDVLQHLASYFEYGGKIYHHKQRFTLCMSSTKMLTELQLMGVERFSNKTFDVGVPQSFHSDDCRNMYLRGCMDGDGSIRKSNGAVRLHCGSEVFIDGLIKILQSMGLTPRKDYVNHKYPGFTLHVADSMKFISMIYSGYSDYRLTRKFNTAYNVWGDDIVRPMPMEKV